MRRNPLMLILLALPGISMSSPTQTISDEAEGTTFSKRWPAVCQTIATEAVLSLSMPELESILSANPLDPEAICQCIEAKMKTDPQLSPLFGSVDMALLRDTQSITWRLYVRGKSASFTMACTASSLERSVDAYYKNKTQGG